ncbi:unnamed protein product [Closterium sp. NIES-54]
MGKVGDASVFRVWGALSLVRDAKTSKLSSRTLRCVFLGFPTDAPPWTSPLTSLFVTTGYTCTRSCSFMSQVDPPPLVEPLEISSYTSGPAEGGDPAADDTAATRRSPRLETPPGFPPQPSSLPPQPAAVDSGAETAGAELGGAETKGEGSEGATTGGAGTRGADSGGVVIGGAGFLGAATGGADSGGPANPSGTGAVGDPAGGSPGGGGYGHAGDGAASLGGTASAGGTGGTAGCAGGGAGAGGTRGAAGAGGVGATSPRGATGAGGTGPTSPGGRAGAGDAGGAAGGGGTGGGGTEGSRAAGPRGAGTGASGAAGAGGAAGASGTGGAGAADQSQPQLLPGSPLPVPAPHTEVTESLTERREPKTRASTPIRAHCLARPRPPAVPGTHGMALRPSSVQQRVVPLEPPASSLPHVPDPESDLARAASPTVTRLLASVVTDPDLKSTAAYTQWSLRRPVYGLRQAPRDWHDTLRTTLAALVFALSSAEPTLFLRTDTTLPLFYVLVYTT